MNWKVRYFQTARSDFPVIDFIEKQDLQTKAKIAHAIKLLELNGPRLKPPFMKKLHNNLYELRIITRISVRIFYSKSQNTYFLLHAFKKKSNKTPLKELRVAIDRMKEII